MRMIGRIEKTSQGDFETGYSLEPNQGVSVGSEPASFSRRFASRDEAKKWLKNEAKLRCIPLHLEADDENSN